MSLLNDTFQSWNSYNSYNWIIKSNNDLLTKWSYPKIVLKTVKTSSTERAKIPGTSMELTRLMRPCLEMMPYDGLNPTTPQYEAGFRTDPPVSEPIALSN